MTTNLTNTTAFLPCGQCRHWTPDPRQQNWGQCELARGYDGAPEQPQTLAYATDIESYSASLRTHANFGCIQAAPPEEPQTPGHP